MLGLISSAVTRRWARAAALACGAGLVGALLTGGTAAAQPVTEEFEFTDAPDEFVVPANVCEITVDALGAEGGVNPSTNSLGGSIAGLGGHAVATIPVTPGETLAVNVGGSGGDASLATPGAGGFNGGGAGGAGTNNGAGGGGGASDVRRGSTPLVVAGGGGAAGDSGTPGEALGGAGGGANGGNGTGNIGGPVNATGGTGGTDTVGGDPGVNSDTTTTAGPGTPGAGGAGAVGTQSGGGGGGGGFFGGGGGGAAAVNAGASAGGGGGSGFGPAGTAFETGVRTGDGLLTITFEPDPTGCPTPSEPPAPSAPGAAVPVAATPRFTG